MFKSLVQKVRGTFDFQYYGIRIRMMLRTAPPFWCYLEFWCHGKFPAWHLSSHASSIFTATIRPGDDCPLSVIWILLLHSPLVRFLILLKRRDGWIMRWAFMRTSLSFADSAYLTDEKSTRLVCTFYYARSFSSETLSHSRVLITVYFLIPITITTAQRPTSNTSARDAPQSLPDPQHLSLHQPPSPISPSNSCCIRSHLPSPLLLLIALAAYKK